MKNIKQKIKERLSIAMARGSIVVDENVQNLAEYLRAKNIRIISVDTGTKDPRIIKEILPNRIFVTNNSKDFIQSACEYDIGIISTEKVKKDPELLAEIISKALTTHSLWSKRNGWILILKKDGEHEFKDLID